MSKAFYGLIFILLLNSCKTPKRNKIIPYNKMNKISTIQLPFEFKNEELVSLIDSLLPDTLLEKNKDLPFELKVFKGTVSNIKLHGKSIDIVLSLNIELDKKVGSFSIASGSGEIEMDIYSEIDIDDKWNLITKTSLVDYSWITKPKMKLLGVKISPSTIVEEYIDYKQTEWMSQIDSTIAKSDLLKSPVDSINKFFHSPLPLDSLGTIGLKISPKAISLSPFNSIGDNITQGQLGIRFSTDLVPISRYENTDTLPFVFKWEYNQLFQQKAIITLSQNEKLTQELVDSYFNSQDSINRIFVVKGNRMKIENMDVIFDNEVVGANIGFTGSKIGNITVKTRPIWDKNAKYLFLHQRYVDIKLDGFGSQFFANLFNKKIKKKILDGLQETLNSKIKSIVDDSNELLKNIKFNNTLEITDYNVPMQLEQDFFMIDIEFSVEGEIIWNKLNIILR